MRQTEQENTARGAWREQGQLSALAAVFMVTSFVPVAPLSVSVLYFFSLTNNSILYTGKEHLRTLKEIRQPAVYKTILCKYLQ